MTGQRHWVRADLVCLQCGRTIGQVAGAAGCEPSSVAGYSFSVFRPADHQQPVRRLRRKEHFHCDVCGGNVLLDRIERFTTYDEPEDPPLAHRRGRRPRPLPRIIDPRLIELGLLVGSPRPESRATAAPGEPGGDQPSSSAMRR